MLNTTKAHILVVCTGNICRSPAAERLLADALAGVDDGVRVSSAGTRPMEGDPIEPTMARLLDEGGVDTGGFAARWLTPDLIRDADVVLAMTRDHRSKIVQMAPAALKRTFTLRELARLAQRIAPDELDAVAGPEADVSARLAALVQLAPRHRGPVPPEDDDVVDPYRKGDDVFAEVYAQLVGEVTALVRVLAPDRA
ncbi:MULTISPECIES: low molecular weight phosphatase family protein [unclassified Janibacter]|uniref:arsenate reductase/protein-tyrosine-phosphatase family protein n=1 Tax=unclassified Janibacter TaxID=2649294 RepID=UPI003D002E77